MQCEKLNHFGCFFATYCIASYKRNNEVWIPNSWWHQRKTTTSSTHGFHYCDVWRELLPWGSVRTRLLYNTINDKTSSDNKDMDDDTTYQVKYSTSGTKHVIWYTSVKVCHVSLKRSPSSTGMLTNMLPFARWSAGIAVLS